MTGIALYTTLLAPKRLEFLRELVPGAVKLALLVNPGSVQAHVETQRRQDGGAQFRTATACAERHC